MPLPLNFLTTREHQRELLRQAEASRLARSERLERVTLREATARDGFRLRRLAALDSAVAPSGPALLAEVDGVLRAALPLDGSRPIADPFHPGCELIELLRLRAAQL